MNAVILMGNVGKDPETRTFDKSTIVNVSLATNEPYKTPEGERKQITMWHNLVFRGKQVEIIEKYVRKGMQMEIIGRIRYKESDRDGVKKIYTYIRVDQFTFTGKAENNQQEEQREPEPKDQSKKDTSPQPEDDLPF